ncbi:MAG: aminotransferase class IV [Alphaproteobacteria bacterium]|nr:aminotransferase class IV [Alphaproteobacteria bacterium]
MGKLWHNGIWKRDDEAVFTANDRIRYGDGVFDTMLSIDGRLIHPAKHFARLQSNAAVLDIAFDLDFETIAHELIEGQEGRFAINTVISRGPSVRGLAAPENPELQIVMRAAPVPADFLPARAIIAQSVRRNEGSPLSRIKSCNYGNNILALNEAKAAGAEEAILLNNAGNVTCGTSANIFAVLNGEIFTPPLHDGVLDGVARQVFMEKYPVRELSLKPEDLLAAESLILTNSIRGGARPAPVG